MSDLTPATNTSLPQIFKNVTTLSFSWYDYIIFCVMLSLSALIGIYFGCFGSKQSTAGEYLMGSKNMKVLPVAISLVASHVSGITLLGVPADIYRFGATYWWGSCAAFIVALGTTYIFLPVFYKLQITSTYEYLGLRFDDRIRTYASFLFALGLFLYLPIVIYIPALAFSAATGVNVHYVAPLVCGICIFYTALGGLKAVVWTDTLQFTITIGAVIAVVFIGAKASGGIGAVFDKAIAGERLNIFDFDFDPTKRDSFWIVMIGATFSWLGNTAVHQSCVQKFLSVPTLKQANLSVVYYTIGLAILHTFCIITGLIIFARYADCDPFTASVIAKHDQLLPFYIMDVASHVPGLPGLFIAGIVCAALSTLSACLNCLAGTIYEDFVLKYMGPIKDENSTGYILRAIVVISGVICTVLVYVIEQLGGILPLALSLRAISNGPLLGMFALGVLFPKASRRGTFYGSIIGLLLVGWIYVMAQYYKMNGILIDRPKPLSIAECSNFSSMIPFLQNNDSKWSPINSTFKSSYSNVHLKLDQEPIANFEHTKPFFLFRIAFLYYTPIGTLATMFFGLLLSYCLVNDDPPVKKDLLSPIIYPFLDHKTKSAAGDEQYRLNEM